MVNNCLIVSGGEFSVPEIDYKKFDYIIACDKGYEYCKELCITPDVIVGDFDSSAYPDTIIPVKKFPTRKDDTDTMLAIKYALDMNAGNITLICALGRRLDHAFANIQGCAYAKNRSSDIRLLSQNTEISFLKSEKKFYPKRPGWSFSCFSLTDICTGVSIDGAKYNLEDALIDNSFPIGVSNTWEDGDITISNESGVLMIIESRLEKGEHI